MKSFHRIICIYWLVLNIEFIFILNAKIIIVLIEGINLELRKKSSSSSKKEQKKRPKERSRSRSKTKKQHRVRSMLFMMNLSRNVSEANIQEIFSFFGKINSVDLPLETDTKYPVLSVAFVHF